MILNTEFCARFGAMQDYTMRLTALPSVARIWPPWPTPPTTPKSCWHAGSQAYINHPRGVQVKDGNLIVSSIYTWFIEDFGGDDAGVIAHLKKYATADLTASLDDISNIADDTYDWSLNKP